MKTIICTLLALSMTFAVSSQTVYWSVYNLKVKNGDDAKVVNAIDKFMSTETGKAMPTATLTGKLFGSSAQEHTHQIIFASTDKAAFGKMYSGELQQTADFQLLGSSLDPSSKNVGAYLGKSLDYSAGGNGNYRTTVSLSVSDPVTYLAEFQKFAAAVKAHWDGKVGIALHRFLSGSEAGVSHVAVIDAPDFETLLDFSDKVYESSFFGEFNMKVKDIRTPVANSSNVVLRRYNVPSQE